MAYIRKTADEYEAQQYTGQQYGWEVVCVKDARPEARQLVSEYRANQPEYPVRYVKKRIPLTQP